ncbi:type VI secretion system membrane subunit TssM [Campylobacter sp. 2018MI35]|uniref:type VI secretion system membrane subunit TssM n=1 Tax=Campylobacter sp. 2018MI34 TaxID=2800582 RepID=UPI001905EA67|nr:type VI secretion system membrane subunit TssM [Campylobacter sp. 2018MI34]MBK1991865.1 type VI secretion system membrane subunit TssM [Campylobacter sp. 2018MI34]
MFEKLILFLKSKWFMLIIFSISLLILSFLFYFWGSLIAFNDFYIFSDAFLRIIIIAITWVIIFLFFLLKPLMKLLFSLKDEKRLKFKRLKKEASIFLYRAKRNFFIILKNAKNTFKNLKIKKLPLIIIIGKESAGKSSLINYSNMEYPLSDSLNSYKKLHQSTNNFALYVSKKGALLDTEGKYFSQEELFKPLRSDELPEDDLVKNKEFLIKQNIWQNFLFFLNRKFFYNKLNGVVLVIDTQAFLSNTKEYSKNLLHYLGKRINEIEDILDLKLPIYIVFSKIDLLLGMREYFAIFNETISNKALGISFLEEINEINLDKDFKELSSALLYAFMNKNQFIYSLEEKNKIYLFLKQFDNLLALIKDFILQIQSKDTFKNNSYLRGVYFISAYQENIPRNFLLDAVCEKYDIKKPLAHSMRLVNKQSYFIKSLFEDIIFKDYFLSQLTLKNLFKRFSFLFLILALFICSYFLSSYFIETSNKEQQKANNVLNQINTLLADSDYKHLDILQKAKLLANLKSILSSYSEFNNKTSFLEYFNLNISYKAFTPILDFYYKLNESILENTLIKEMENILQTQNDPKILVETLYMYRSLFKENALNKELLKKWIDKNWIFLNKYELSKENFLNRVDTLKKIDLNEFLENKQSINEAFLKLNKINKFQRIYFLLNFLTTNQKEQNYNLKDELGFPLENIFANKSINVDLSYNKKALIAFLRNINQSINQAINIDDWVFDGLNSKKESKNFIILNIIKLYLEQYKEQYKNLLLNLAPQRYTSKEALLDSLNILASKENPIKALIQIINTNTNLNDALLLSEAYNLGINASEIKTAFMSVSNYFSAYHTLLDNKGLIDNILNTNNTNNINNIMDIISEDLNSLINKISSFTNDDLNTQEKINYIFNKNKEANDVFDVFLTHTKKLPPSLQRYYSLLASYSYGFLQDYGFLLLNNAWFNEVYSPFINNIAPFYPFNNNSNDDLSIDAFKEFFGKNGTLNQFYEKYLNNVLIRKKNEYFIKESFAKRFAFSKEFLTFLSKSYILSNLMLDLNDNVKINFMLKSLDLSSSFSFIELSYNSYKIRYDHTLKTNLQIIGDQFNTSTILSLNAYSFNNTNINYNKNYKGEWAWYKLLKEANYIDNNTYSILFDNNKDRYFDFMLISGASVSDIVKILDDFRVIKSIRG